MERRAERGGAAGTTFDANRSTAERPLPGCICLYFDFSAGVSLP